MPDLTGSTGTDLTSADSATVHVQMPGGTMLTRPAAITRGTEGAWSMPWQVGELDVGLYLHELEVVDHAGGVRTFPGASFRVGPQLDLTQPVFAAPLTVVDNLDGTSTATWSTP